MWFTINADGTQAGEILCDGGVIHINVGTNPAWIGGDSVVIFIDESPLTSKSFLVHARVRSCSETKLVLDVSSSNLSGFNAKQITFTRVQ